MHLYLHQSDLFLCVCVNLGMPVCVFILLQLDETVASAKCFEQLEQKALFLTHSHDCFFVVCSVRFWKSFISLRVFMRCSLKVVINDNNMRVKGCWCALFFPYIHVLYICLMLWLTLTLYSNDLFVLFCLCLFSCFLCSLILPDIFSHPGKHLHVVYYIYTILCPVEEEFMQLSGNLVAFLCMCVSVCKHMSKISTLILHVI